MEIRTVLIKKKQREADAVRETIARISDDVKVVIPDMSDFYRRLSTPRRNATLSARCLDLELGINSRCNLSHVRRGAPRSRR